VLALAILGLLAVASPADTTVRVPGTTLRFGLDDNAISARGFAADASGVRTGRCRFFGLTSDARLTFESGRLARAEFAVSSASTYEIAYVHDQLTAMGYRESCEPTTSKTEICDWTARTSIHLEVSGGSLKASVVPASAATVAAAAARDTARATRSSPANRVIAPPRGATTPAGTAALDTTRAAAPIAGAVPVLPETLAVNLPGRTSSYSQATLLSEPHCDYPGAARAAGIQGRVWVFALVGVDGRVIRVQLKSGIAVLNAAALACVRDWNFKPVAWKGAPCRYWVLVPVTFTAY
jgi:TonB family protein